MPLAETHDHARASGAVTAADKEVSLKQWLIEHGSALIGFSGGVDSTYLACVALGDARSEPRARGDRRQRIALERAKRGGARHREPVGFAMARHRDGRARGSAVRGQPHEPLLFLQARALVEARSDCPGARAMRSSWTGRTRTISRTIDLARARRANTVCARRSRSWG